MRTDSDIRIPFTHRQAAHCESGVASNLLSHYGLALSEPLAFGIGGGLFFGYFPFIRLNNLPLTTFRAGNGRIIDRVAGRLNVKIKWEKFRNPQSAMAALDRKLEQQTPVGCRTGAYWLTYFPRRYRFHFNMHNLVAYGRSNGDYLISDPVFPEPVTCPEKDLRKARFARGPLPPKGKMYYVTSVPAKIDLRGAIVKGIKAVCNAMTRAPVGFIGVKGIRYLADKVEHWPQKLGEEKAALNLGQVIRMQEEIGTGGAGFRFLYAAFLQESASILDEKRLLDLSQKMTTVGDRWRDFALIGSRICKNRASRAETYPSTAAILRDCAAQEEHVYKELRGAVS